MCSGSAWWRSRCARSRRSIRPGARRRPSRRRRCAMTEAAVLRRARPGRAARLPRGIDVACEVLTGIELTSRRRAARRSSACPARARPRCCRSSAGSIGPTPAASRSTGATSTRSRERERGALRNRTIGFIYQFHHLLPEFSALENVAMPLLVRRETRAARAAAQASRAAASAWVSASGSIIGRISSRAASGSAPRWRARWWSRRKLVLADEPTGNLDGRNAEQVFCADARAQPRVRHQPGGRHARSAPGRAHGPGARAERRTTGAAE